MRELGNCSEEMEWPPWKVTHELEDKLTPLCLLSPFGPYIAAFSFCIFFTFFKLMGFFLSLFFI